MNNYYDDEHGYQCRPDAMYPSRCACGSYIAVGLPIFRHAHTGWICTRCHLDILNGVAA